MQTHLFRYGLLHQYQLFLSGYLDLLFDHHSLDLHFLVALVSYLFVIAHHQIKDAVLLHHHLSRYDLHLDLQKDCFHQEDLLSSAVLVLP